MLVQKVKSLTYQVKEFVQRGGGKITKMTPFSHEVHHIKTINLTRKYFKSC